MMMIVASIIIAILFILVLVFFVNLFRLLLITQNSPIRLPNQEGLTTGCQLLSFFTGLLAGIIQFLTKDQNLYFFLVVIIILSFYSLVTYEGGGNNPIQRRRNGRIGSIVCSYISFGMALSTLFTEVIFPLDHIKNPFWKFLVDYIPQLIKNS